MEDLDESDEESSDSVEDRPMPPPKPAACARVSINVWGMFIKIYPTAPARITEKYRPEPEIEPRASRLTYERSTIELSRSIQFHYLNLVFFLITLLYRIACAGVRGCGCAGMRAWYLATYILLQVKSLCSKINHP